MANVYLKCIDCNKHEVEYVGKWLAEEDERSYTTECKYRCNACGKQMCVRGYHLKEHNDILREVFDIFS